MKKPLAMIVAGVLTTLSLIGGTLVAFQTGVFASATTIIQPNGEISVPTAPPPTGQSQHAIDLAPIETPVDIQTMDPTGAAEPTAEIVEADRNREATLLDKLNEAYRIMEQRDQAYQAKLKEAYDKLKAASATSAGAEVNNVAPSQPQAPVSNPPAPSRTEYENEHKDEHRGEDRHPDEDRHLENDEDKSQGEDH